MGVYIKNMKAPVTCSYCPLIGYDPNIEWNDGGRETQGAYICVLTHELIDNTKREDHCPLVPVPPHGRLADADEMKKSIRKQTAFLRLIGGEFAEIAEVLENGFLQEIDNAPTIIPAEPAEEGE